MIRSLLFVCLCAMAAVAQPPAGPGSPLKINEIYFTGSFAGGFLTGNDQFVELYNSSPTDQVFLDGLMLVSFGAGVKPAAGVINSSNIQAYKFPGNPGGHLYPVDPQSFIVIAQSAQDYSSNKGLNLSGADWECYSGNTFLDKDNPAPNLTPLGAGLLGFHLDFVMSATDDEIALCDGTDTTISDGINAKSILDAVEYHISASSTKVLPMQLDRGFAGVGAVAGKSIERKTAGFDTDNSTVDFDTTQPTPGFEHGSGNSGPLTMQPNIDPLSYLNYKIYDEYTIDTNNVRQQNTLHRASTSVLDTTLIQGGLQCAQENDSTFDPTAGPSFTINYLRNTNGIDIDQFADVGFWNAYLGPAESFISLPTEWLTMFKGSEGFNIAYPISKVDTTISLPLNGTNVSVAVNTEITGKWASIDTITVPMGTYPCYVFKITVATSANIAGLISLFNNTYVKTVWFARGIGIVKSVTPPVNISISAVNQNFAQPGVERDLRGIGIVDAVHDAQNIPTAVTLAAAYPNPFTSATTISFGLPAASRAALGVYDIAGNLVRALFLGAADAGTTTLNFNARGLSAGTYFLKLQTGQRILSQEIYVVR